ncbi:MAG: protein kinase [Anaerolineae bacterium]
MALPGTVLQNRYRVMRQLGSGGMGAVYLAEHLGLGGKAVALKENAGGDPNQFQTEANILARLNHTNLVRVIDHFLEPNGSQYLVMDYVDGQNLETIVKQSGPLAETVALARIRKIFGALKYLHSQGIIHRDVKPQNIIITPSGEPVLVDFGIAKILASGSTTTQGARAGSPGFAPPEQYVGGTTVRSDVYSLGATLYYVLTGIIPPESPHRSAGTLLVPPRQIRTTISARTEATILKAMNLNAAQRYQSIGEMEQELYGVPYQVITTNSGQFAPTVPVGQSTQTKSGQKQPGWLPIAIGGGILGIVTCLALGLVIGKLFSDSGASRTPTVLAVSARTSTLTRTLTATFIPTDTPVYTVAAPLTPAASPSTPTDTTARPAATTVPTPATASSGGHAPIQCTPATTVQNMNGHVSDDISGTKIALCSSVSSVVDNQTKQRDVYAMDLVGGQEVRFTVIPSGYVRFNLFNPSSKSIETNRYSEAFHDGRDSKWVADFMPAVSGTYYFSVSATGTGQKYSLSVDPTGNTAPAEQVSSDIPGTRLDLGKQVLSVIDNQTKQRDVYAIDLAGGQEVRFTVIPSGYLRFNLFNPGSKSISTQQYTEAFHDGRDSNWVYDFMPNVSGTYYFAVTASGTGQTYTLSVEIR